MRRFDLDPLQPYSDDVLRRLEEEWRRLTVPDDDSVYGDTPVNAASEITEILHERSVCFGSCPAFFVRFTREGLAVYEGRMHVSRIGSFVGAMPVGMFDRLAAAALRGSFFKLDASYVRPCTDMATVTTQVRAMDVVKTVTNYGNFGPQRLATFEATLMRAVERIGWTPDASVPARMLSFGA